MKRIIIALLAFFLIGNLAAQDNLAPGTDVVGFGYDIFGKYADQSSKKRYCLFKYKNWSDQVVGNKKFSVPENVYFENISKHTVKTISGSSMREYAQNLAVSVDLNVDAFLFSGSLSSDYQSTMNSKESYFYYNYMDANVKWRISLDIRGDDVSYLREMLEPRFKNDVDKMNPSTLFSTYGTHYIASAYLGGRAENSSSTKITSTTNTESISVAVTAEYKAVSGGASTDAAYKKTLNSSNTKTELVVTGGNSEYANSIADYDKYKAWADGIAGMPVLCDFDKESLRPIWEFASTTERKNELKAAFNELLKVNKLPDAIANSMIMNSYYYIQSNADKNVYWDLPKFHYSAPATGGRIGLHKKDNGADRFFKIIPVENEPQYVYLQPQNAHSVVDVVNASTAPGAKICTWNNGKGDHQKFKMIEVDGQKGCYYLQSKKSKLFLTKKGSGITQENKTAAATQQWNFVETDINTMAPPAAGKYKLRNMAGGKYLDLPGSGAGIHKHNGANVTVWSLNNNPDRTIELHNVANQPFNFIIQPLHSTKVLDIQSRSKDENAKVVLWDRHNAASQQFKFEYAGEPLTYYIKNINSNKYLQVEKSVTSVDGSPITQTQHKGKHAIWRLEPAGDYWATNIPKNQKFLVKSAYSSKVWDIQGGFKNGSRLFTWSMGYGANQQFKFIPSGDHSWVYIQEQGSKRNVEVEGRKQTNDTKILIWDAHGANSQKFAVKPTSNFTCVILSNGWKAITVHEDKINENGKGILLWDQHYHASQQYQLIYADGPKKGKPFMFFK